MPGETKMRILVIGGDDRFGTIGVDGAALRALPSPRYGGNGGLRRATTAIIAGAIDLVVLVVRWLGHSDTRAIRGACRAAGIPCRIVQGGATALKREIAACVSVRA